MACAGCSVGNQKGSEMSGGCSTGGCGSKGGCATGGCNRMNTYDWLSDLDLPEYSTFDLVEVSFKNGARKGFYHRNKSVQAVIGEAVIVEVEGGYDVGNISLSGELVKMQMKKRNVRDTAVFPNIVRKANERDLEKLTEIRKKELESLIQARTIAKVMKLDMKMGDVEFQGDGRKCTFFYTAEGRVDFRELIREYAKVFKVKIEMRQIGARQEAARIGGLGSCGRELCCSTWLTDFKSVNTTAARYQNLAINQVKLSGQCGRLKCCLNYELDAYMEAFEAFPKHADHIQTGKGRFDLIKTDIFKGLMFYMSRQVKAPALHRTLTTKQVRELQIRLKAGEVLPDLVEEVAAVPFERFEKPSSRRGGSGTTTADGDTDFSNDVDNVLELPADKKRKRKKKKPANDSTVRRAAPTANKETPNADGTTPTANKEARPNAPRRDDRPRRDNNRPPRPNPNPNANDADKPKPTGDGANAEKPTAENKPNGGNPNNNQQRRDRPRPPRDENRPPRDDSNRPPRDENRPPRDENRPPRDNSNRPPRDENRPPRENNNTPPPADKG